MLRYIPLIMLMVSPLPPGWHLWYLVIDSFTAISLPITAGHANTQWKMGQHIPSFHRKLHHCFMSHVNMATYHLVSIELYTQRWQFFHQRMRRCEIFTCIYMYVASELLLWSCWSSWVCNRIHGYNQMVQGKFLLKLSTCTRCWFLSATYIHVWIDGTYTLKFPVSCNMGDFHSDFLKQQT